MTKSRGFRPDQELSDYLDKHNDLPVKDAVEQFYREKFSAPAADITTSDGNFRIGEDPVYHRMVLQRRTVYPSGKEVWAVFHPEKLEEQAQRGRADSWKRDIAEQELAMKKEQHGADMTLKKVAILRAQKKYAPETVPRKCLIKGCSAYGVLFANLAAYNEHLHEFHPDRIADGRGVSLEKITAGEFYGRLALPEVRWSGQP